MNRRQFATLSAGALLADSLVGRAAQKTKNHEDAFSRLRARPATIDMLVFERMDQIDFTGPFSVLSRLPNAEVRVVGLSGSPIRDHKGLVLTPQFELGRATEADILVVPGGRGQQALMDHQPLLGHIAEQAGAGRAVFSVCTGALLCGAAGILKGRRATTHWSALELLHFFGAHTVNERVVQDGNLLTAAGVTAGIDGALTLAALVRGDEAAQRIQLDIQYAPQPPFNAGAPATAPQSVLAAVRHQYEALTVSRRATAQAFANAQPS